MYLVDFKSAYKLSEENKTQEGRDQGALTAVVKHIGPTTELCVPLTCAFFASIQNEQYVLEPTHSYLFWLLMVISQAQVCHLLQSMQQAFKGRVGEVEPPRSNDTVHIKSFAID